MSSPKMVDKHIQITATPKKFPKFTVDTIIVLKCQKDTCLLQELHRHDLVPLSLTHDTYTYMQANQSNTVKIHKWIQKKHRN